MREMPHVIREMPSTSKEMLYVTNEILNPMREIAYIRKNFEEIEVELSRIEVEKEKNNRSSVSLDGEMHGETPSLLWCDVRVESKQFCRGGPVCPPVIIGKREHTQVLPYGFGNNITNYQPNVAVGTRRLAGGVPAVKHGNCGITDRCCHIAGEGWSLTFELWI